MILPSANGYSNERPVTLHDMLSKERVSFLEMDPKGRRVVFFRIPTLYEQAGLGVDYLLPGAGERALTTIGEPYVYSLDTESAPQPLLTKKGVMGWWSGGFSPSGTRFALYWIEEGRTKAGVYDFATGHLVEFPFTPYYFPFTPPTALWISDQELIYSAWPEGKQSAYPGFRRATTEKLERLWEEAYRGDQATSDVLASHTDATQSEPLAGKLLRVNAVTAKIEVIGEGLFAGLSLSPSKQHLIAARVGGLLQPNPSRLSMLEDFQGQQRSFDTYIFDLRKHTAALIPLANNQPMLRSFTWSSGAEHAAFFAALDGKPLSEGDLYLYDATTHDLQRVERGKLAPYVFRTVGLYMQPPMVFADGVAIYAKASSSPDAQRFDWYLLGKKGASRNLTAALGATSSEPIAVTKDVMYLLADGDIWRIPLHGSPSNITAGFEPKLSIPEALAESTSSAIDFGVLAEVADSPRPQVVLVNLLKRSVQRLPLPADADVVLTASAMRRVVIYGGGAESSSEKLLASFADGHGQPFWTFNRHMESVLPPRMISLSYRLADGRKMASSALLPWDWVAGQRAPVVVNVYPGTGEKTPARYYEAANTLLTSMGYIVLSPNSPQSLLGTKENPLSNWAGMVLPAFDALVEQGYADPQRAVIYGTSQGSWSALSVATQTDRFKATLSSFGASNFISDYGTMARPH
jgi:dipeptidyl aminopeptidase/acylaminoacyl peptidase